MSIFELWILTTVVPGLGCALHVLLIMSIVWIAIMGLLCMISELDEDVTKFFKKHIKKSVGAFVVLLFLNVPMPSERQMLLIAGGYTATNNAEIKKLPTNAAKAVNAWLDAVTDAAEIEEKK